MKKIHLLYVSHVFNCIEFDKKHIEAALNLLSHDLKLSKRDTCQLIRLLLTHSEIGPDLCDLLMVFGKKETIERFSIWHGKLPD